jgi:hypothetical protein
MCGRARLSSDVSEIKLVFSIPPDRPTPNFAPSWNVAPTDPLPIVRYDVREGARSLDVMRWGLIPFWAKDIQRDRARRPAPHGHGRAVGDVALAGGREGAQLLDRHHDAERAVRGAARSHAGRSEARSVAGVARRGAGGRAPAQVPARALPGRRNDLLAGEHAGRSTPVGNVKNNDPGLIEPIAAVG